MRRFPAWLRSFFEPEEASLSEVRERFGLAVGRTVPAELAIREPSEVVECGSCRVLYRPRAGASVCLACERGGKGALGKLIAPRPAPQPEPADVPLAAVRYLKERGG